MSLDVPAIRQWRCCERAAEEAKDENGGRILRQCATDLEAGVYEKADQEDGLATNLFRERTPYEGTNAIAGDKERNGEYSDFLPKRELLHKVGDDSLWCG